MKYFHVMLRKMKSEIDLDLSYCPLQIPYAVLQLHDKQAIKNHGQSVKRLNERGGMCPQEIVAVLLDKDYEPMDKQKAIDLMIDLLDQYYVCAGCDDAFMKPCYSTVKIRETHIVRFCKECTNSW